jgi:Rhodopirellula transposase DDE domain
MVAELLHEMDYSLQANRKTLEGSHHPDRDAQVQQINSKFREFQADHQPVISVDTKKKELVSNFKNNGRELRPKGDPEKVRVYDFVIKVEHRLFSFISQNWRGKPLVSHQVIVNPIAATTTKTGLRVRAEVDPEKYLKGIRVSDKEVASIRLERDEFHGEWNYTIRPRST